VRLYKWGGGIEKRERVQQKEPITRGNRTKNARELKLEKGELGFALEAEQQGKGSESK